MTLNEGILIITTVTSVVLTGILVLITARYADSTRKYLEEFQKDRKVRLIQDRLENFYSPYIQNQYLIDLFPSIEPTDRSFDYALRTFTDIRNHAYLVDNKSTRSEVEEYLSMAERSGIEHSEDGARFKELKKSVNKSVRTDYENLLKTLGGLMN